MATAIFIAGGKQYKVKEGDSIYTEKLDKNVGEKIEFSEVLMIDNKIGAPFIKGATVTATIEKHGKQPKIHIVKFLSKKHHYKRQGHRQPYTKITIDSIKA